MASFVELSDGAFEDTVRGSPVPVVVAFSAPWCGPCKAVEATLERLAERTAGRVTFARVDVDAHPLAASRYGVLSLPTVIVFDGAEARKTIVGARGADRYERALAPWLE